MRLVFFVAIPRAPLRTVMDAFHDGTLTEKEIGGVQRVKSPFGISTWRRVVCSIRDNMPPSEAPNTKWSIWCVTSTSAKQTRQIYRWLGRYRIAQSDRVLGPYDPKRFLQLAAGRADDDGNPLVSLMEPVPWVIFGDNPDAIAAEEYDPNDTDIGDDTDIGED